MRHAEAGVPAAELRRPMIKAGLRRLRRDPGTVQFGTDPDRAVLLTGLDPSIERWLDRLDGSSDLPGLHRAAADAGLGAESADTLLGLLLDAGLVEDAATACPPLAELSLLHRDRLGPDLVSLMLVHPGPDGGKRAFAARACASVQINGGGRVGAALAGLLAAAGVRTVEVHDPLPTGPGDLGPGGLGPDDLGAPRGPAATRRAALVPGAEDEGTDSLRRAPAARGWRSGDSGSAVPVRGDRAPDGPALVVLTGDGLYGPTAGDALLAAGIPHLVAAVRETSGVVGPLVLPGRSSCLRCHDLTRADRDPGWPRVAAQLAGDPAPRAAGVQPCDTVLATAVAAHGALQALAFLESGTADTVDGTLHLTLPGGGVRRRSWPRHPACGCSWGDADAP